MWWGSENGDKSRSCNKVVDYGRFVAADGNCVEFVSLVRTHSSEKAKIFSHSFDSEFGLDL